MACTIYPISLGLSVAFLLAGEAGLVLVDGGLPGFEGTIWARVKGLGFQRQDLRWIVLTHPHVDHCGCLPALLGESGALLAAHPLAAGRLQGGPVPLPAGRQLKGRAMAALFRLGRPWLANPRLEVAIPLADGTGLEEWGLPARVLHTPGHTADSLSLLLEDGTALVGDLLVGAGRRARPQPYFIEDDAALAASLDRLQRERPRAVYSSHCARPLQPPQ